MAHRADLYADSDVLPLDIQRKLHGSHFVYRALNQESTNYLNDMYSKVNRETGRVTRSTINDRLTVPTRRTECAKGNIRVRGAMDYNEIALDVRESSNINIFKHNLSRDIPFTSRYM